eukprot:4644454-Lingulodinium_polyedra.AAC.1
MYGKRTCLPLSFARISCEIGGTALFLYAQNDAKLSWRFCRPRRSAQAAGRHSASASDSCEVYRVIDNGI